jgi:hypothetical protein
LATPGTVLQTRWICLVVVNSSDTHVDVEFANQPRPKTRTRPFRITADQWAIYAAEASAGTQLRNH